MEDTPLHNADTPEPEVPTSPETTPPSSPIVINTEKEISSETPLVTSQKKETPKISIPKILPQSLPYSWNTIIGVSIFLLILIGALFYYKISHTKIIHIESGSETLTWEKPKTPLPWENRDSQTEYVWNDRLFVLGGLNANEAKTSATHVVYENAIYFNDIWYTDDGEQWIEATAHALFPPIRSASIIPFNGALWMLGGFSPDPQVNYNIGIWKSTDGITWAQVKKEVPFPQREGFRTLEINGKICFFGGVNYFTKKTYNDVWCSPDGVTWTAQTKKAPWDGRWDYDAAYYHGAIYLAGGMNMNDEGWNDVWKSTDEGITWERIVNHAPWTKRQGQVLLVWKDVLWLIGGLEPKLNTGVGDTWFTTDGINWQKTNTDGPWRGREDHGVAVWRDALWLVGGMNDQWTWDEGVWKGSISSTTKKI